MGQKFDMGAETLTVLNKQTSMQGDNLGALIKELARASEPVEKSFQGPARAAFDVFQQNADKLALEINRALGAILTGSRYVETGRRERDHSPGVTPLPVGGDTRNHRVLGDIRCRMGRGPLPGSARERQPPLALRAARRGDGEARMQQAALVTLSCDRCLTETRAGEQHCPECGAPIAESSLARPAWLTSTISRGSVPASPATRAVSLAVTVVAWLLAVVVALGVVGALGGSIGARVTAGVLAAIVAALALAAPWLVSGRTLGNLVTRTRSVGVLSGTPIGWRGLLGALARRTPQPTADDLARHPDAVGPIGRRTGVLTASLAKGRDPRSLALRPHGALGAPSVVPPAGARSHARSMAGPLPSVTLEFDGGSVFPLSGAAVVGRNPPPTEGAAVIAVPDLSRLLSKTHARIEWTGTTVVVTDLGSTNGTALEAEDGTLTELAPYVPTPVPLGVSIALADRSVTIHYREGGPA